MANPAGRFPSLSLESLDEYIPKQLPIRDEDAKEQLSPLPSDLLARLSLNDPEQNTPRRILTPRREAPHPLQERVDLAVAPLFDPQENLDVEMKDPPPPKGVKRALERGDLMQKIKLYKPAK